MSVLYETLTALCKERGITGYKMCRDIGMQPSIMTDLKMGRRSSVKLETAQKIADYFGVSTEYLLGKEEQKEKPATSKGSRLSVNERVEQILEGMANEESGTLMLDGKPASPEALEALRQAIKMGVEYARKINNDKK